MKMVAFMDSTTMSVKRKERAKALIKNNFSRNPEDYGWTGHSINRARDKGYGKEEYVRQDGKGYIDGRRKYGVQDWHFRYLIREGETELEGIVDGEVVIRFVATIESDKGEHKWILPVVMNEDKENKFKTTAYPKGPSDGETKRLYTFKPEGFEESGTVK